MVSEKTIQRLILYRKILNGLKKEGIMQIYSHKLAHFAGSSSAQVRRDLMAVGYNGSPAHGYNIRELVKSINQFLDTPKPQKVAIIGLGNLGRAILDYCHGRNPNITIEAAFDSNPAKVNKVIQGCHCYHIDELEVIVKEHSIQIAILAIPPDVAQRVAERTINSGVLGILNYSPTELMLPSNIYVENRDMMLALEKVSFFAGKTNKS